MGLDRLNKVPGFSIDRVAAGGRSMLLNVVLLGYKSFTASDRLRGIGKRVHHALA
ncbi:MAG: hypothetical protein VYA69_00950 [Gemmatimonadota bacterium]|nr:hypothetical protein [Gemmatimonadota bacterium]